MNTFEFGLRTEVPLLRAILMARLRIPNRKGTGLDDVTQDDYAQKLTAALRHSELMEISA